MLVLISIAAVIIYRKKKGSSAYNDMLALGNQYINGGFPQWLLDNAAAGKVNLDSGHLVKGKPTDYGKLLAAYTQQYVGRGYDYKSGKATPAAGGKYTGDEKALHDALWARFYQEKNK